MTFKEERMALIEENKTLIERLNSGRDYLMSIQPKDLTVEDSLEAFGFGKNGLRG